MSPTAAGTDWTFNKRLQKPIAKMADVFGSQLSGKFAKKGIGTLAKRAAIGIGAGLAIPFLGAGAAVTSGLMATLFGIDYIREQLGDYSIGKAKLDKLKVQGKISEEDSKKYLSLLRQETFLPFGVGNKLFGEDEMMIGGHSYDPYQQQAWSSMFEDEIDFIKAQDQQTRAKWRQQEVFSEGGRVGMRLGGDMGRREFLKWLAGLGVGAYGAVKGLWKPGAKKAVEQVTKETLTAGNPEMWIPRLIQKIKAEGKLIGMADKSYVTGDKYEAIIKGQKVKMENNPVNGETQIRWDTVDSFGDDMERAIHFKEGEWIPPTKVGEKGTKTKADFEFVQPNQSDPYRKDIDYFDWDKESDEILDGMKEWIGVEIKESTFPPSARIYEDFAEGGEVETGAIARRQSAVPPLSGPSPHGTGIVGLFLNPKEVRVG
jgi:hypothetical protein